MATVIKRIRQRPGRSPLVTWQAWYLDAEGKRHNRTFPKRAAARAWLADQGFLKKTVRQSALLDPVEVEAKGLERAHDALDEVVAMLRRHKAVTPEGVAMVTSVVTTMALLEREIGRRLTGSLKAWEVARDDEDA